MTSSAAENAAMTPPAVIGLRERKKARTRIAIRSEAIRLFSEQGFASTTVEQIAEAADVSPSTFFRYFPTKEAVIITDEFDPVIFQQFREQPLDVPPIRAFRNALKNVYWQMTPAVAEQERLRQHLLQTVPELRSAMLEEFGVSLRFLAGMIGERVGRSVDDPRVRALSGALIGVVMSVTMRHWSEPAEPGSSPAPLDVMTETIRGIEEALELLELGLPI